MVAALDLFPVRFKGLVLLILISFFLGSIAQGQTNQPLTERLAGEGQTIRGEARDIEWDLDHLQEILAWMDENSNAAGATLVRSVTEMVFETLSRSLLFMEELIKDDSIEQSVKLEAMSNINASVGAIFFRIIRHHGQDSLKDRDLSTMEKVFSIFKEFFFDIRAFYPTRAYTGQLRTGFTDRLHRDALGHETVLLMQRYAKEVLPTFEDDRFAEYFKRDWTEDAIRAIRLRSGRLTNQTIVAATYFGFAVWAAVAPPFDVIGWVDGRSDNSLIATSMAFASAWVVLGSLKSMTISATLLEYLDNLKILLQDPSSIIKNPARGLIGKLTSPLKWWRRNRRGRARTEDSFEGTEEVIETLGETLTCRDVLSGK